MNAQFIVLMTVTKEDRQIPEKKNQGTLQYFRLLV